MKGGMTSPKSAMKGSLRSLRAEKGCFSQLILGNQVNRTLINKTSRKRQSHLANAAMAALMGGRNISMVVEREEGEMQEVMAFWRAETVVVRAETLGKAAAVAAQGSGMWRGLEGSLRVSVAGWRRKWTRFRHGLGLGLGLGLERREKMSREEEVRRRFSMLALC